MLFFFFFQAEDGIRDRTVTGVQTCALPISGWLRQRRLQRFQRGSRVAGDGCVGGCAASQTTGYASDSVVGYAVAGAGVGHGRPFPSSRAERVSANSRQALRSLSSARRPAAVSL